MSTHSIITINFRGGIISPGNLLQILEAAEKAYIRKVSFGTRQQLLVSLPQTYSHFFTDQLDRMQVKYEKDTHHHPNVVSSYPAEEVFITRTWLSEGVYKDIFDLMTYDPVLKVNISNSNQCFTPILTGNINWVASLHSPHFWHLFIRFPKTNKVFEWDQLVYSNDIARVSRELEETILENKGRYFGNERADGNALFDLLPWKNYITKTAGTSASLPPFNLPYYEGLNRHNDKYWLGIYGRTELFDTSFLKDICRLCLETKLGHFCSTSWKSILIKGIGEKHRPLWNALLAIHRVNVRHAANELNFQVEDHCKMGLSLKNYLVRKLSRDDIRTFGICIGIKTRKKSEVFSSILIRQRHLLTLFGKGILPVYDILCAKDFNPNERTGALFCSNTLKFLLPGKLRRAILSFYRHQAENREKITIEPGEEPKPRLAEWVYQCVNCLTIYDPADAPGELPGSVSGDLPSGHCCSLCESPHDHFRRLEKSELLQAG